jgi:hypothetical protein
MAFAPPLGPINNLGMKQFKQNFGNEILRKPTQIHEISVKRKKSNFHKINRQNVRKHLCLLIELQKIAEAINKQK